MSKPVNDIWKDPGVLQALKAGRSADDIAVLACPICNRWGYYNEGSHFSCRFCRETWYVCSEDERRPAVKHMYPVDGHTTLADTITETIPDEYHNRTLPGPIAPPGHAPKGKRVAPGPRRPKA